MGVGLVNAWGLPSDDEVPTTTIFYDVGKMMEAFERIAQQRRDQREALEFLLYLAKRDRRHVIIDKSPGQYDAWISVEARPDEEVKVYVMDRSILEVNTEGLTWNSTGFTSP